MSDLGRVSWDKVRLEQLPAPLRWCIDVFARCLPVDEQESLATCGNAAFAAFLALGLLRAAKKSPAAVLCPVWVYPVDGFVVASDRRDDPDGNPYSPPEDVVFPAIYAGTFDVSLDSGDHISGSFDPSSCTALGAALNGTPTCI